MLHSTGIDSFIPTEDNTIAILMKEFILSNTASIGIEFPLRSRKFSQIVSKVSE
jgi:hypothetical protein